jgi:hypothetical protein
VQLDWVLQVRVDHKAHKDRRVDHKDHKAHLAPKALLEQLVQVA